MGAHEVTAIHRDQCESHHDLWGLESLLILFGSKLSAITPDTLSILTNREIIAINQDPVYEESISPFRWGINVRNLPMLYYQWILIPKSTAGFHV